MNEAFKAVATTVKGINKKGAGLYGLIGAFVLSMQPTDDEGGVVWAKGTDIKPMFQEQEKQAAAELKMKFGKDAPSTYRVAKGVFVNCVMAGISLTDDKGKLRGKTDLEAELDALKVVKTELDKFKSTMATAGAIADKLPAHDRITAAALVQELLSKTANGIALAA